MKSQQRQTGVTLVEMLIVMGLAVILTAIGIPSYRYVTTSNRVAGEINGLLGDLQFARYEALKEGLTVTICPTASATTTVCDAGQTTWSEGWIVLSNAADNATATSVVLRRQLPFTSLNSNDVLTGTGGLSSVSFNREGFAVAVGTSMFSLHDPTANAGFTRCLMVSGAGALSTATAGQVVYTAACS